MTKPGKRRPGRPRVDRETVVIGPWQVDPEVKRDLENLSAYYNIAQIELIRRLLDKGKAAVAEPKGKDKAIKKIEIAEEALSDLKENFLHKSYY